MMEYSGRECVKFLLGSRSPESQWNSCISRFLDIIFNSLNSFSTDASNSRKGDFISKVELRVDPFGTHKTEEKFDIGVCD